MSSTEQQVRFDQERRKERFVQLLLPLRSQLTRFARAMVGGDIDETNDLVSDTILAAFERFDDLRGHQAFLSYLFTIAVRLHKRRRWRRRFFGRYDEEHALSLPDAGPSPEKTAEVAILHRALAHLPERMREAVVLFEITGLSLEEVRDVQGGSISGVKPRVSRGRKELARLLGTTETAGSEPTAVYNAGDTTERNGSPYLIYTETHSNG